MVLEQKLLFGPHHENQGDFLSSLPVLQNKLKKNIGEKQVICDAGAIETNMSK